MKTSENQKITIESSFSDADKMWMKLALSMANEASLRGDVPVGCVITRNGELISVGFNERETTNNPLAHAEILAIDRAAKRLGSWRLLDCEMFVTLEPCFMCAGAIVNSRISRVIFSAFDPKAGAVGSLENILVDERLNHRCQVNSGLFLEESADLLKCFFAKKRKKRGVE